LPLGAPLPDAPPESGERRFISLDVKWFTFVWPLTLLSKRLCAASSRHSANTPGGRSRHRIGVIVLPEHRPGHEYALAHKHDHSAPDVLIEFSETAHNYLDHAHGAAEYITRGAKLYYGHHAFRKYSWLKAAPGLNKVGNLRGMVLDKKARAIFDLTVETGEKLEKFGKVLTLAGWAIELAKSKNYIKQVLDSPGDGADKSQKICAEVSMATIRALTGPVPIATHAVAAMLLRGVHRVHAPQSWEANITRTDLRVKSFYKKWTNTDNVVHYINTHLTF